MSCETKSGEFPPSLVSVIQSMKAIKYGYISLVVFRFVLTLIPQNGYIHPDEFFQSSEVVYGDLLGVVSTKPWEFESDKPIRSIIFPYFMVGLPSIFLHIFDTKWLFGTEFVPYLLLVLPRLFMCFLSLIHDVCLYKMSKLIRKDPFKLLIIFASSYVVLVHLTRTFSNSLEALFFSILVYTVILKSVNSSTSVKNKEHGDSMDKSGVFIGALVACGCFNRPTFVLFSVVPIIIWLFALSRCFAQVVQKACAFLLALVVISSLFAVIDTIYYEGEYHLLANPSYKDLKKIILTPLNFVLYNTNAKNLAHHGKHPKCLHFLVNIPLTFSVLGILALLRLLSTMSCFARRRTPACSKLELFFLVSFSAPVSFLSLFSHQEPRFLLPILLPLVCLCGEQLYDYLVKYKVIAFVWLMTNIFGIMFFGFVHQAGIYPTLNFFHTEIATRNPTSVHNIMFYHTYMPPRHLLAIPKLQRNVYVHDLSGSDDAALIESVQTILNYSRTNDHLYIVLPSTITISLINLNIMLQPAYNVRHIKNFFPHVSIEALPSMHNVWLILTSRYPVYKKLSTLKSFFNLNIYKVQRINKS